MNIEQLGWNEFFDRHFERFRIEGFTPARITTEHRQFYLVYCEHGELTASVSGRMLHQAQSRAELPTVGDWVAVSFRPDERKATIHALLTRKSSFSRKAVQAGGPKYGDGRTEEQVLAANMDVVFLVSGLDGDFNPRRIERYLTAAWDSGANPIIVLNKADVCPDLAGYVQEVETLNPGVPVHPTSAVNSNGLETLRQYVPWGSTAAFLGSSGVGKSTIINKLIGEERLDTGGVRLDDSRGRHTTTRRELILLPEGGLLIDTPGMREIQMWGDESGIAATFSDIQQLVMQCRFSDCKHETEPGCMVRTALDEGSLDSKRYESYLKLQKEQLHLARKQDKAQVRREEREWDKKIRQHHQDLKELRRKGQR